MVTKTNDEIFLDELEWIRKNVPDATETLFAQLRAIFHLYRAEKGILDSKCPMCGR